MSIAAALTGLLVARASLAGLLWIAGDNSSVTFFFRMLEIDRNVLAFTLIVALLAPLLFSLLPALRATRQSLVDTLKEGGGRAAGSRGAMRGRRFLVGAQVALALSLMVVSGVLIRAMLYVRTVDLGYDGASLLTMRIDLPEGKYNDAEQQQQFFRDAIADIRALPEIESAAWVSRRPMAAGAGNWSFQVRGRPENDPERAPWAGLVTVDPAYFDLINVRLLRGRMLGQQDAESALPVVLVNQDVVTRHWDGGDPVGEYVRLAADAGTDRWLEIVGVVTSLTQLDPDTPSAPFFYVPLEQNPRQGMALIARTRGEALAATAAIRRAVWAVDTDQPISDVRTMRQIFNDNMASFDAVMSMFSAFAGFALVMAAAGIYGVMSFLVTQRTREFGIRMALGAVGSDVRTMVMRSSTLVIALGAILGLLGGYGLAIVFASGVPEVEANDPIVYVAVGVLLTAVSLVSVYIPARRATRVDPMVALRAS